MYGEGGKGREGAGERHVDFSYRAVQLFLIRREGVWGLVTWGHSIQAIGVKTENSEPTTGER